MNYTLTGDNSETKHPVIIVTGVNQSGKTTISNFLGSSPQVEAIDEEFIPYILPTMQAYGQISKEVAINLLRVFTNELMNDLVLYRKGNFRPSDKSCQLNFKTQEEVNYRLEKLKSRSDAQAFIARKNSKLIYNIPAATPFADFLFETFQDCHIVRVVRDGRAVAHSIKDKNWFSDDVLINDPMAYLWRKVYSNKHQAEYHMPWWVPESEDELFWSLDTQSRGLYFWILIQEKSQEAISKLSREQRGRIWTLKFEDFINNPLQTFDMAQNKYGMEKSDKTHELCLKAINSSSERILDSEIPTSLKSRYDKVAKTLGYLDSDEKKETPIHPNEIKKFIKEPTHRESTHNESRI